VMWF